MYTKKIGVMLCVVLVMLGGCVPSLHKLYTEEDVVFKQELMGFWTSEGMDDRWEFRSDNKKSYELNYADKEGKEGKFEVHLVKLEDKIFMDLYPSEPNIASNDFYKLHLLGVHTFMLVKQIEPVPELSPMDYEELKNLLEDNPEAIKHEIVEGRVILTASTKELQDFVVKHAGAGSEIFGDIITLNKKKK